MAKCKFCGKEISWMKDGRKNVPVEGDGTTHTCDEMINSRDSIKTLAPTNLTAEEIARYEKGINEVKPNDKKRKK